MLARSRLRIGAREHAELRGRHGQRAAAAQRIVEQHPGAAEQRCVHLVQRLDAGDLVDHPQLQMVLQIFADAGLVEHDRNAVLRKLRAGPTPESSSDLRSSRSSRPTRITSPRQRAILRSPFCRKRTPIGAPAVELDALDQAAGFEPQVRPAERRLEKAARRRPAPAALLVDVDRAPSLRCRRC